MKIGSLLRNRFLRDSTILQVAGVFNAGGGAISSLLVAHILLQEKQGMFVIAMGLYSICFFLLNLGVVPAAVSQVAAASARGGERKVAQWLALVLKVYVGLGILFPIVGWFVLPWAGERFYDDRQLGVWAFWLSFSPWLELPRVVATTAFQGTRRMFAVATTESGQELSRIVLVVLGAWYTDSAAGAVLGTLAAYVVGSTVAMWNYRRVKAEGYPLPTLRTILGEIRDVPIRRGLSLGIRLGMLRNMDAIALNILPPLVAGKFGGKEWAAFFRVALQIVRFPMTLTAGVSRTALPALSELAGRHDFERFRRTFVKVTLLTGTILTVVFLAGLPLVKPLIRLLYPDDYAAPVFGLLLVLLIGFVPSAYSVALDSFYLLSNKLNVAVKLNVIGFVVVVVASIVGGRYLGEMGAALGLVIAMSWSVVHYVYIAWWFRSERRRAAEPSEPPRVEAAGGAE